eukprot:5169353-Prymnesium_polylepis.1
MAPKRARAGKRATRGHDPSPPASPEHKKQQITSSSDELDSSDEETLEWLRARAGRPAAKVKGAKGAVKDAAPDSSDEEAELIAKATADKENVDGGSIQVVKRAPMRAQPL